MDNQEKSGLNELAEKGVSTAHAVHGAIKTGKAIAGAAKGASMGGAYGAIAGLLWENRKTVGKVIAASIFILMLPVLFILMLPSLIFGGLGAGMTEQNTPVINDSTVISQNVTQIVTVISSVLNEGQNEVYTSIEADFAASGADRMEIINPYSDDLVYNGSMFIAQYCASKNENYTAVSIDDMENTLRSSTDTLYTYTTETETRTTEVTTTTTDPDTGDLIETTTEVEEIWIIYTVLYQGEYYFADTVFHLTEDQKALATNYANNLSLFLSSPYYMDLFLLLNCTNTDITLSAADITAILSTLPSALAELRREVVLTAFSLVGKVNYFWGGKSTAIGWDSRWGAYMTVSAPGSSTTGTVRPYGLDCSGFVTWAFINAAGTTDTASLIGHGTYGQIDRCTRIRWTDAQPGDLVFLNDLSHVGIVVRNSEGTLTVVHCSSSGNNVTADEYAYGNAYGFGIIGRPNLYEE